MESRNYTKSASRGRAANSLDIARNAFSWLVTGPAPVSLDGREFPGLPHRLIPMDEVRDRLLARHCPQTTRDAVWAHLVCRSRSDGATWTVVAVGVALPALISVAATLTQQFAGDPSDVHAEILRGFLTALAELDVSRPKIMVRLRWAAYRAGHRALREALDSPTPVASGFRSSPPHPPWGHPDLVLARAIRDGVLTRTEADLIGATRLDDVSIAQWAQVQSCGEWVAYKIRKRAEARLIAYLRDTQLDIGPSDPVVDRALSQISQPAITATSLSVCGAPDTSPPQSLDVTGVADANAKKVGPAVSKKRPKSGVQGCGESPRFTGSSEAPQCA